MDFTADLELIFQRVVKEKQQPPRITRKSPGSIPSRRAATKASPSPQSSSPHNRVCTFCHEEQVKKSAAYMERLLSMEVHHRRLIGDEEALEAAKIRAEATRLSEEMVLTKTMMLRSVKEEPQEVAPAVPRNAPGHEALILAEQLRRRRVEELQAAEFDNAAAWFRLTLRTAQQTHEVSEKLAKRTLMESSERRAREAAATTSKADFLATRQRRLIEDDEAKARLLIEETEASVLSKILDVAGASRREIRQHEARVEAMMQKHLQRLELLEAELTRIVVEEGVARERHYAAERKAFEGAVCMEPDLRKRANAHARQRQARELSEQQELKTSEISIRASISDAEAAARRTLTELSDTDVTHSAHREERRLIREARRVWREKLEQHEHTLMLLHENIEWDRLGLELQSSAFTNIIPAEESAARQALRQQFEKEMAHIDGLLLQRENMLALYLRRRSESALDFERSIAMEWCDGNSSMQQTLLVGFQAACGYVDLEYQERAEFDFIIDTSRALVTNMDFCREHPSVTLGRLEGSGLTLASENGNVHFATRVNAPHVSIGGEFRLIAAAETGKPIALEDHPGAFISVRLLNPQPGDELRYKGTIVQSGAEGIVEDVTNLSSPFEGVTFACYTTTPTANILVTRVVEYRFLGARFCAHVQVTPPYLPPVCQFDRWLAISPGQQRPSWPIEPPLPTSYLFPFRSITAVPPPSATSVRCSVHLRDTAPGRRIAINVTSPFKFGDNGISRGATSLCKKPTSTQVSFLADTDITHYGALTEFLALSVGLSRGDACDTDIACVVRVEFLVRDYRGLHTVSIIEERIPWNYNLSAPLVAFPETIAVRSACPSQAAERADLCIKDPFFAFVNVADLEFTRDRRDRIGKGCVVGGSLELELSRPGLLKLDIFPTERLHSAGWIVEGTSLRWKARDTLDAQFVGHLSGRMTHKLRIEMECGADNGLCPTAEAMSLLFLHIATFTGTPVDGSIAFSVTLNARVDLDVIAMRTPLTTRTTIRVSPAQLVAYTGKRGTQKTDLSLNYVEGAPPKPLPAFNEITPPQDGFGLGARLSVDIVLGSEPGDEISLADALPGASGCMLFKAKGALIGWWVPTNPTTVCVHLCGDRGILATRIGEEDDQHSEAALVPAIRRVPIYAPYTAASLWDHSSLTAAGVMLLLRAVRFRSSVNPKVLKKLLKVTFDDGRTGRSTAFVDINIENVDDPTLMIFETTTVQFAPLAVGSRFGVPLMSGVRLEDPDSDNFHDGFISLESQGFNPGDTLVLYNEIAQVERVYNGRKPAPVVWQILESHFDAADNASTVPQLHALPLLVQLFAPPILKVHGERLFFKGESIGTITTKPAGSNVDGADSGPRLAYRIDFAAESKFIPFSVAEYVLRCFAFDSKALKPKLGPRKVEVKLTAGTTITTEVINVSVGFAVLSPVLMTSTIQAANNVSVTIDESVKQKQLLPQAVASISGDVLHMGFFKATLSGAQDASEELVFESQSIKAKEKTLLFGKDVLGVLQHPRISPTELYLIFSKVNGDSLTALARGLTLKGIQKPGLRKVTVRCCIGTDESLASVFTVSVVVPWKLPPPRITSPAVPVTLTIGGNLPFTRPFSGFVCRPSPVSGSECIAPGSQLEVSLTEPFPGDVLILTSAQWSDVALSVQTSDEPSASNIEVMAGDRRVAVCPGAGFIHGTSIIMGTSVCLTIVDEAADSKIITALALCIAFGTWNKSVRGVEKRLINFRIRELVTAAAPNGGSVTNTAMAEATLPVELDMLPQLLSISQQSVVIVARSLETSPLLTRPKVCVSAPDTDFVDVLVQLVDGETEALAVELSAYGDFTLDSNTIKSALFTMNVKEGGRGRPRKMPIASLMLPRVARLVDNRLCAGDGDESCIQARFSPVTASTDSAVTAWLESFRVSSNAASVVGRSAQARITLSTKYTTSVTTLPLLLKQPPTSFSSSSAKVRSNTDGFALH